MRSVHELSLHHLATLPSIFLSSKRNLQAASFSHGCSKNLAYRAASKEWGAAGEEADAGEDAAGDEAEETNDAARTAEEETGDVADGAEADAADGTESDAAAGAEADAADGTEADTGNGAETDAADGAADEARAAGGAAEAEPQSLRQFLPLTFSRRIPFLSASQKHALGKSTCSDFMTSPMESRLSSMQTKQRHRFFLVLNDRLA